MKCLRCNTEMLFYKETDVQFGAEGVTGVVMGDWAQALEGALPVQVYLCPNCRRIEFFTPENKPPMVYCPYCGKKFSLLSGRICPVCGEAINAPPKNTIRPKNF